MQRCLAAAVLAVVLYQKFQSMKKGASFILRLAPALCIVLTSFSIEFDAISKQLIGLLKLRFCFYIKIKDKEIKLHFSSL